jgi:hypothetical protein
MDDITLRATTYLYIGGLQNGLIQTDPIANWESSKYVFLVDLQLNAANITMQQVAVTQKRLMLLEYRNFLLF